MLGPCRDVVAALVVAANFFYVRLLNQIKRERAREWLPYKIGSSLLREPHWRTVATSCTARHVPVVVQHDVYVLGVGEVENAMETIKEGSVECVLVAWLCTRPDDSKTNEIPTLRVDQVSVVLVERCAGRAVAGSRAGGID